MFYFNLNKLTSLNKFAINKLNPLGKLSLSNREKIVYPLIFVSIILALFIVDITKVFGNSKKLNFYWYTAATKRSDLSAYSFHINKKTGNSSGEHNF